MFSRTAMAKGIDNTPSHEIMQNVMHCAGEMERVRELLNNHSIHVDSWYRCFDLNRAVGGSSKSAHTQGWAVDFVCPSFGTPREVCLKLASTNLEFDQLICEGRWVHLSFALALRRQVLTALFKLGKPVTYVEGITA